MRLFAAVSCLFVALSTSTSAFAADLPPPMPAPAPPPIYTPVPVAPFSWTGFYLGANAGYGFANASATLTAPGLSGSSSETLSGFIGGGQLGVNYQYGIGVFGIETDFEGSTQSNVTTSGFVTETDKITYIGTVRGRIGAAFDRILLYATAGGGYGTFSAAVTATNGTSVSAALSHFAWVAGAGLEFAFTNNLSARIEYLYLDTGSFPMLTVSLTSGTLAINGRVQDSLIRAGLNWRFTL